MKNINEEALRWVQVGLFLLLWVAALSLSGGGLRITWRALQELPHVVFAYAIVSVIFIKWGWRWRIFRGWLVPFPDLQGTWTGEIKSTWVDPATGQPKPPLKATLAIRQTFSSISCVVTTEESESESTAAQLNEADGSEVIRISYTYINRPRAVVRHRSEIHDGAAVLTLKRGSPLSLEGQYWTSRKTIGDLLFRLETEDHEVRA
jgi:hypothetical protein